MRVPSTRAAWRDSTACPDRAVKIAAAENDNERRLLIMLAFDSDCATWTYEVAE